MGRAPCCDKATVKKGPWSPEEDAKLKAYIQQHGTGGNWIALPQKIGLKRCGKSCRLRWLNYLRPNIKHGGFSEEEDNIICSLYVSIGSRWSIIAAQLPGRTDNDIKNYWNTKLKKKLLGKQRKQQEAQANSNDIYKPELIIKNQSASSSLIHEPYNNVNNLRNMYPYECDPLLSYPAVNDNNVVFEGFEVENLLLSQQMDDGFVQSYYGGVMESSSSTTTTVTSTSTATESSSWADMVSEYQEKIMLPQEYVNVFEEPSFFGSNNFSTSVNYHNML